MFFVVSRRVPCSHGMIKRMDGTDLAFAIGVVCGAYAAGPREGRDMETITGTPGNTAVLTPFHMAFSVHDIAAARHFYADLLGCPEGRSAETWIDFNLFGHQIVAHYQPKEAFARESLHHNPVDGHEVPVPHFGVVLDMQTWRALAARLKAMHVRFVIEPYIRFEGEVGEQATMFFLDPSGNALEFKAFADFSNIFAK